MANLSKISQKHLKKVRTILNFYHLSSFSMMSWWCRREGMCQLEPVFRVSDCPTRQCLHVSFHGNCNKGVLTWQESFLFFGVCLFQNTLSFIGDAATPEKQITKNPFADHIPSFKSVDLEGKSPSNSNTITSLLELSPRDLSYLRTASRGTLAPEHTMARDSEAIRTWTWDILHYS